jgi:hypothetical protein
LFDPVPPDPLECVFDGPEGFEHATINKINTKNGIFFMATSIPKIRLLTSWFKGWIGRGAFLAPNPSIFDRIESVVPFYVSVDSSAI